MTGRTLSEQERAFLLEAAIRAPSMHNTQPWLFRVDGSTIEIFRDPSRELPAEDPEGRAILISVGAVVLNIRTAAAAHGRETEVALVSDPERPTLVAVVRITTDQDEPRSERELGHLYPYVDKRRTNRWPFADEELPRATSDLLSEAARAEGASLDWATSRSHQWRLQNLAAVADLEDTMADEREAERGRWIGGTRGHDGIPSESLGPRPKDRTAPVRDLAVGAADRLRPSEDFEPHPALAVLSTRADTTKDWITAGRALQRVLLEATAHGLSVSLLNQALEHRDLRWLARDPVGAAGIPQAVLRFGHGPAVPATPRRAVPEFLVGEDPPVQVAARGSAEGSGSDALVDS